MARTAVLTRCSLRPLAFLKDLEEFRNFLVDDKEPNETWMDTAIVRNELEFKDD